VIAHIYAHAFLCDSSYSNVMPERSIVIIFPSKIVLSGNVILMIECSCRASCKSTRAHIDKFASDSSRPSASCLQK
jgi:hypothetical protein